MSLPITLSPTLRVRIAHVARRVRLLRAMRGASLLLLVLASAGGAALLADYFLDLPAMVRQCGFAAWLSLSVATLLFAFVVPLCRRLEPADLAAVIEQKYPELGERLTSSVELAADRSDAHGSPILIALLMQDTERRTNRIDFRPAVPVRATGFLAATAVAVLAMVVAPAFVWPDQVSELSRRFFLPWQVQTPVAPYVLLAAPGNTNAAKGRPLTLSAQAIPRKTRKLRDSTALPTGCTLVVIAPDGSETRQPMTVERSDFFSLAYTVPGDFHYRFEAGLAISDTYQVTAVTPVELAAESPTITVKPPLYARAALETETFHGLADLSALQHSEVYFAFRFTRPAVRATLVWTTTELKESKDGTRASPIIQSHVLPLSDDRLSATFRLPAMTVGTYQIILEAEHQILTQREGGTLVVKPDLPPAFLKFSGKEELRAVLPYDRIPLQIKVADDVAVARAELEYRVNGGTPKVERLALDPASAREVIGKHVFQLSGKVRAGDEVRYRLRAMDNFPREYKGPHTVYYPVDRWLTLKIARGGSSLKEEEILAQHEQIRRRLEKIRSDLAQEKRAVYKVQAESARAREFRSEDADQVKSLVKENRASENALRDLERDAAATPALQQIADRARDVADEEMRRSESALNEAGARKKPLDRRTTEFAKADKELASALQRLDELKQVNDRLAKERLDQAKVEMLADRQKQLAEKAAELASRDPIRDPRARDQSEQLKREQAEVATELQRLAMQSETIRKALENARAEQARQLAERARELAQEQRDLTTASADTDRKRNAERLAALAHKQQELAEQAAKLAQQTRQPARAASTTPLRPEEAQKAAEALKKGNAQEAVKHQDQTARDLDRLANALDRAVKLAEDPREAARQLARLQGGLKQRVQEEMRRTNSAKPLTERLQALMHEQEAIRQAAEQLSVPSGNRSAQMEKRRAGEEAAHAAEFLKKQNPAQAQVRMDQTRVALERLADQLPTLAKRRQLALREIGNLRRQQDDIGRQMEQGKKGDREAARQLAEAARRQAEVAEAISKLDAPKEEARQERTSEALNRALADLMDNRRADVPASQQEARRQLERLEQKLRGEKPADEKAQDLAKRQRELASEAARAAADPRTTPQKAEELKRKQEQVAREAKDLPAPEAPQRKAEAVEAARKAAQSARAQPTSPATQQHMREAADRLDKLARQMKGEESEADKARRLAKRQAETAAETERNARLQPGKAPGPEAQQRQKEVAAEAKDVRGGDEAQAEKKRTMEALARVQEGNPREQAAAQRKAADALRDLADQLAGRKDASARANKLAQEQAALARDVGSKEPGKAVPEEARKASEKQAEIARQVERLDPRGAPQARKEAMAAMAHARKTLDKAQTPAEAREPLARAARAAEELARQLAKEEAASKSSNGPTKTTSAKPGNQSPRQLAQQLAREQRDLAKATQQAQQAAAKQPGAAGKQATQKAMQQLARQQGELNRKASQLPSNQAQQALQQARAAMNQAKDSLDRKDAGQAQQKQNEAVQALDRLAQKLPARAPDTSMAPPPQAVKAPPLPTREQTEQARQLARQQRELQQAVQRATETARNDAAAPKKTAVSDLARQQAEIARQASELARNVDKEQGAKSSPTQQAQQASKSAQQAADQMHAGALEKAQQAGQKTAEQMRKLAAGLAQTPKGATSPKAPDTLQQARRLQQEQEALNRQLNSQAVDASAQKAQQQTRQQELKQKADDLTKGLRSLALQMGRQPQAATQAFQAAQSSQQSQNSMQQAQQQGKQGNEGQARQSQQQAAQALDRAAQQAAQAAKAASQPSPGQQTTGKPGESPQSGSPKAGQAVQQAQGQMSQAQAKLGQGQSKGAQSSMQQAAQSLEKAAQELAQQTQASNTPGKPGEMLKPGKPGQPATRGYAGSGRPDPSIFGLDKTKYAGKTWGELPGELRTKLYQDMKAKYGEDYARYIKLYFEQLADTKK